MRLSVIIVNWNTRDFLAACLDALRPEVELLEAETFVVDNASTDESAAMVRERFPWVHLIESRDNLGFGRGNNLAIARAVGDYVWLLNPDTVIEPGAARALVAAMEAHPEWAAATSCLVLPEGAYQSGIGGAFPTLATMASYYFFLSMLWPDRFPGLYMRQQDLLRGRGRLQWVCGASMIVRRQAIEQVGPFSDQYFMYAEDMEWCHRFQAAGWSVGLVKEAVVRHDHGASTKKAGLKSPSWLKGMDFYLRTHLPAWQLPLLHLIEAGGFVLRGGIYALGWRRTRAREMFRFMRQSLELAF